MTAYLQSRGENRRLPGVDDDWREISEKEITGKDKTLYWIWMTISAYVNHRCAATMVTTRPRRTCAARNRIRLSWYQGKNAPSTERMCTRKANAVFKPAERGSP